MQTREKWIDGLKGLAILHIILVHCWGNDELPLLMRLYIKSGQYWVQLFFLISIFLMFRSLESFWGKEKKSSIIHWYSHKFINLIPLYYLAIILYGTILGGNVWKGNDETITVWNYLSHFAFLHGLFPKYSNSILYVEWYLGVLALAIILAPLLFRIIDTPSKAMATALISPIACFGMNRLLHRLFAHIETNHDVIEAYIDTFSIIDHIPTISLGILLYYVIRSGKDEIAAENCWIASGVFIFLLTYISGEILETNNCLGIMKTTRWGIFFIGLVLFQKTFKIKFITNPFFVFLGKISYSLYLFHYFMIIIYNRYVHIEDPYLDFGTRYLIIVTISVAIGIVLTKGNNIILRFVGNKVKNGKKSSL